MALTNRPVKTYSEVFEAYIEERFERYESRYGVLPYSRRDTRHYLEQLALQLGLRNQSVFSIRSSIYFLSRSDNLSDTIDLIYHLVISFFVILILTLTLGIILGPFIGLNNWQIIVLNIIVFLLLYYAMGYSSHVLIRLVLWRCTVIPRNYAKFLKYTSELRLTRQTGGEFRFFHDLLRDHLAQSVPPPSQV